jgi:ribonuclease D
MGYGLSLALQPRRAEAACSMTFELITDAPGVQRLADALADETRLAIDLEAAGFHRYSDRVCLIQLTGSSGTFLVDPLAVDPSPALRGPLESPDVRVLLHGGDYDLRLLDRDLDLHPVNLFDTQTAAALLGEPSLGLASLLETYFDVRLSKKYQRADWAQRPLSAEMLEYAASDTQHLHALTDLLSDRLTTLGRLSWAEEESTAMEAIRWSEDGRSDPVTRVKKARYLDVRDVALVREAWLWRDEIAQRRDRAPFRVAADAVLLEVVQARPSDVAGLAALSGFSPQLAERSGKALLGRLERVDQLEDGELVGFPKGDRSGPGRPSPEVEEVAERLKVARNMKSDELGIARGSLASNTLLLDIARSGPKNAAELVAVPSVRNWQVEALGDALINVLTAGPPPPPSG